MPKVTCQTGIRLKPHRFANRKAGGLPEVATHRCRRVCLSCLLNQCEYCHHQDVYAPLCLSDAHLLYALYSSAKLAMAHGMHLPARHYPAVHHLKTYDRKAACDGCLARGIYDGSAVWNTVKVENRRSSCNLQTTYARCGFQLQAVT